MKGTLNERKAEQGTWPEYKSSGELHSTIIRVMGEDSEKIYLKAIDYQGPFPEFVKEVFNQIMTSDPDASKGLQHADGSLVYEMDHDQRTDQQIVIESMRGT